MKWQLLLAVLLLAVQISKSQGNSEPVFPKATGWVTDNAGLLTDRQKDTLCQKIGAFEKTSGNELAILTLNTVQPLTLEDYASRLFNQWGIGKKGLNNGVLILAARHDRKVRIEVGDGLTRTLTNDACAAIIRDYLTPNFAKDDFFTGFNTALDAIIKMLNSDTTAAAPALSPQARDSNAASLNRQITCSNSSFGETGTGSSPWKIVVPIVCAGGVAVLVWALLRRRKTAQRRTGTLADANGQTV